LISIMWCRKPDKVTNISTYRVPPLAALFRLVVGRLYDDFHKVNVSLGFSMEMLNERLLGVESRVEGEFIIH
jgi:hypothetical protein